jgi:hypothetical protein
MGRAVVVARSRARAAELRLTTARLQAEGITSLGALTRALTDRDPHHDCERQGQIGTGAGGADTRLRTTP